MARAGVTPKRTITGCVLASALLASVALPAHAAASTGRPPPVVDACTLVPRSELETIVGGTLSDGVLSTDKRNVSGCAYAAPDVPVGPNVGILVTNRARGPPSSSPSSCSKRHSASPTVWMGWGAAPTSACGERPGGAVETLLLATDGNHGVQVALTGQLERQQVLDTSSEIAARRAGTPRGGLRRSASGGAELRGERLVLRRRPGRVDHVFGEPVDVGDASGADRRHGGAGQRARRRG